MHEHEEEKQDSQIILTPVYTHIGLCVPNAEMASTELTNMKKC